MNMINSNPKYVGFLCVPRRLDHLSTELVELDSEEATFSTSPSSKCKLLISSLNNQKRLFFNVNITFNLFLLQYLPPS